MLTPERAIGGGYKSIKKSRKQTLGLVGLCILVKFDFLIFLSFNYFCETLYSYIHVEFIKT